MLPGLEPAELPADAIEVGRILDGWGIKGWFKVLPYSADPEALFSSRHWFLLPSEKGTKTFSGVAKLKIIEAKVHSDSVVACARDVADRNAADALRGARIFISRSSFPAVSTGPQTVLVLDYQADGKTLERMIPFVSVYIDSVDLPGRRILVDWQADF